MLTKHVDFCHTDCNNHRSQYLCHMALWYKILGRATPNTFTILISLYWLYNKVSGFGNQFNFSKCW